ncbi:hypothetical protein ACFL7E_02025 [Thermodesulfobacteriota bacterium]
MTWYRLNYREMIENGFAVYETDAANLVVTLRGTCMVDTFDLETSKHAGYLDFDIKQEVMLGYAFGSPIIGLPFTSQFRRTLGSAIIPFQDLRTGHDVGFYIEKAYRNKGEAGIWNLDEIMMTIALEIALEHDVEVFTIRPTGDRARYYRRKFGARVPPTTGSDVILSIDLKTVRKRLKHIELVEAEGKTDYFRVKGSSDL